MDFIPSGTSANFYAVLKNFYGDLRAEWILQGNSAENFEDKGCKFVIVFESIEKLDSLLNKLLNEGELIMKWNRKIKNKGNLINAV